MAQARKKAVKKAGAPSKLTRHLKESAFLLSILVAVYIVACLATYDPTDPGPFNSTNSDQVHNAGRILGAWIADALLGLTGYIAYLSPLIVVYGGWRTWSDRSPSTETRLMEAVAVVTGLALFLMASTGLCYMHLMPPAGTMPAGGGGVVGDVVATPLMEVTGLLGSTLFLFAMTLVGITLFTGLSWFHVMDVTGRITLNIVDWVVASVVSMRDWFAGRRARAKRDEIRKTDQVKRKGRQAPKIEPQISIPDEHVGKRAVKEKQQPLFKNMPADSLPPLELLDDPADQARVTAMKPEGHVQAGRTEAGGLRGRGPRCRGASRPGHYPFRTGTGRGGEIRADHQPGQGPGARAQRGFSTRGRGHTGQVHYRAGDTEPTGRWFSCRKSYAPMCTSAVLRR